MSERKKGFLANLMDKLDEKLKEKSRETCCCSSQPKKEKNKGCCDRC